MYRRKTLLGLNRKLTTGFGLSILDHMRKYTYKYKEHTPQRSALTVSMTLCYHCYKKIILTIYLIHAWMDINGEVFRECCYLNI